MSNTNVYYWNAVPNFGDRMAVDLLNHFSAKNAVWSEYQFADVVVTGSLLEQIPSTWPGIVAGVGALLETSEVSLPNATVLALRGPLTLARVTSPVSSDVVLGDPGLLADEMVDITTRDRMLGILPHWRDTRLANVGIFQQFDPLIISPFDDPMTVIKNIGRCQKLVTSSLHGVIVADAFGIPRRYEQNPFSTPDEGGMFKAQDYAASVGVPFEVGVTQQPNRNLVEDIKHELFDMFQDMKPLLP